MVDCAWMSVGTLVILKFMYLFDETVQTSRNVFMYVI
jgi:hypothetical protein